MAQNDRNEPKWPESAGAARTSPAGPRARRPGPGARRAGPRVHQGGAKDHQAGPKDRQVGLKDRQAGSKVHQAGPRDHQGVPGDHQAGTKVRCVGPKVHHAGPWDHEAWPRAHPFVGRGGIAIPSRPALSDRVRPARTPLLPLLSPAGGFIWYNIIISRPEPWPLSDDGGLAQDDGASLSRWL